MTEQLLKDHPKVTSIVKDWLVQRLLESAKGTSIPEDFVEYAKQNAVKETEIVKMLGHSPSVMFELFDGHNLLIEIEPATATNFIVKINGISDKTEFSNRLEADKHAISEAFKILEGRL